MLKKFGTAGYAPPVVASPGATPTVTFYEAGSYELAVTKVLAGQGADGKDQTLTTSTTSTLTIRPTVQAYPRIISLVDGSATAVDKNAAIKSFDDPIELTKDGALVITAEATPPAQAGWPADRRLAILNRANNQIASKPDGSPEIEPLTVNPPGALQAALSLAIPRELLLDRLNQLAVLDVWTGMTSTPPYATVVISTNPKARGGSIGPTPTGPNVEFPEFTAPRSNPDGFNPSDNVQTRVSRLYYFRDAHRVAQIINRDARAYNYPAVATHRRLAEDSRDAADSATDSRRSREIQAVRAAQASRKAELEAKDAQAKLADAQAQVAQKQSRSFQLSNSLTEATSSLDETTAALTQARADLAVAKQANIATPTPQAAAEVARLTNLEQSLGDEQRAETSAQKSSRPRRPRWTRSISM